ncbi:MULTISPECIES: FadR/GntR family transcriptional regulator [Mesorhizobium]|uniref:FadR family transcriptional regulator n=1 Tax=Mesorhizobium denitrificans TaxID=2294114 RepID=A0A371XFZ0_9HYPH|nr:MULTISPECIES: FCD domain-containing protein [Mesorhizobium]RFC68146.1 FadR family transcriptional regulator [Mesorhizobium denitrificans]
MDKIGNGGRAALVQLQAYLAQIDLPSDGRLPSERELCDTLGVSRGDLRKALDVLERDGHIWRHVGKGTFVGSGPVEETIGILEIAGSSSPADVMHARLIIEPEIAREAALHATTADIAAMRHSLEQTREAATWRQYENIDNLLHRQIAQASRNNVLLGLFDVLNAVRRTVVWGRLRADGSRPPADHHSFTDHERIVSAIEERDLAGAASAMRAHLQQVERRLIPIRAAAE